MKKISVYQNDEEIGYLILDNNTYFPYTVAHRDLKKGFFRRDLAENYLKSQVAISRNFPKREDLRRQEV